MANKAPYRGNARFIELGSEGAPFRSLINVDHITNIRFEQDIREIEAKYDDEGQMTAPPQQMFAGWHIVIQLNELSQRIAFGEEAPAVQTYNLILDLIGGVGAPMQRLPKLKVQPVPEGFDLVGPDGKPIGDMTPEEFDALNDDDILPGEIPELTDEELAALENPEIDVDAIAEAVEAGVGSDEPK